MTKLKKGAKGADVKALQEMLNKAGAKPKVKPDSSFGAKTEEALKAFQKTNRLKDDGVAGPKTMALLNKKGGGGAAVKPMKWPHDDYVTIAKTVAPVAKENIMNFKKLRVEMRKFVHPDMDRINPKFDEQFKGYIQAHKKWEYNVSRMVTFQTNFEKFQKTSPGSVQDVLGAAKKIDGVVKKCFTATDKHVLEMWELEKQFRDLQNDLKAAA